MSELSQPRRGVGAITFENAGQGVLDAGIASFGMVFASGAVRPGDRLSVSSSGGDGSAQMDVRTTHADGSVKMAVLAVRRPALDPGTTAAVTISSAAGGSDQPAMDFLAGLTAHRAAIEFGDGMAGIDVVAALRAAVLAGTASFWQQGPLVSQARVSVEGPGALRVLLDVTLFDGGGIALDIQFANDLAMAPHGDREELDIAVRLDGAEVARESVDLGQYQGWHLGVSGNGRDGGQGLGGPSSGWLNIRHEVSALEIGGAVADYDQSVGVSENLLASYAAATRASGWGEPLSTQGVSTYMPGTGGRSDIGFTTAPNAAWLISQDIRAATYALGQAEAASAIPWHMWDGVRDTWLGTDHYPVLWIDYRGGKGRAEDPRSGGLSQNPDARTGWTLDTAHQPDLSFVPYVLTGERWILDNLQAQAAWSILAQWPVSRGGDQDLVVRDNQVRGAAWSLRQIDEAAWASPTGSPEQAYFAAASAANWSWLVKQIPAWTAMQGEAHGWLPGVYGTPGAMPPWQQDYFAGTAIAAARQGNTDAAIFLEWQSNFLVGRFTHAAQGFAQHDGAAYLIAIADPATGTPYTSWAAIGAATAARGWTNGDGWSQTQGDYGQLALATLAGIAGSGGPSAVSAATAYAALLAKAPPFTRASDFHRDPAWAIAAPGTQVIPEPRLPEPPPPPVTTLVGDADANLLVVGPGRTLVTGLGGDDTLMGGSGDVRLDGGAGNDVYVVHDARALLIERLDEGYDSAWFDVSGASMGDYVERGELFGTASVLNGAETAEALVANPLVASLLRGRGGDDVLWGSSLADTLDGGDGRDVLRGGGGEDQLIGGAGDDDAVIGDRRATFVESVNGGADTAWVTVNDWTMGINVEIGRLAAPGAVRLWGSDGGEALVANQLEASILNGGGGDDTLWGSRYADLLIGGAGNDIMRGQGGDDTMIGGAGDDQYVVFSTGAVITEWAGEGYDIVHDCAPGSLFIGENVEEGRLYGQATGLVGNGLPNLLVGNNTGLGSVLRGGGGDDIIFGTPGADVIDGGPGADTLYGYGGADRFVFAAADWGVDQVNGFIRGSSLLDFSTSGLSLRQLSITQAGANTLVVHGTSMIVLYEVAGLHAGDFLF